MTDVKVEAVAWPDILRRQLRLMHELESRFKSSNSVPVERTFLRRSEFDGLCQFMAADEDISTTQGMNSLHLQDELEGAKSTITALQQRIADLTNANLRMLGERDRARIAEGEVAKLRAALNRVSVLEEEWLKAALAHEIKAGRKFTTGAERNWHQGVDYGISDCVSDLASALAGEP